MIVRVPGSIVAHDLSPDDSETTRCGLPIAPGTTEAPAGTRRCGRCHARRRGLAAWAAAWEASVLAAWRRAARRLVVAESERQRRRAHSARMELAESAAYINTQRTT